MLAADTAMEAQHSIRELTESIAEEAGHTLPFSDSPSPTGLELATEDGALRLDKVMGMAVAASSAAHQARSAAREPELPSHDVLVGQALDAILAPPAEEDLEDEQDVEAEGQEAEPEDELDNWFVEMNALGAEQEDEPEEEDEDEAEWGEVEDEEEDE